MSGAAGAGRPSEEELRRRITALDPEALAAVAQQTGLLTTEGAPPAPMAGNRDSQPAGAANGVHPASPPPTAGREGTGQFDPDALPEQDVEAMIEQLLGRGDTPLDLPREDVRSGAPPPTAGSKADGGQRLRKPGEDAALAAQREEEGRPVAVNEPGPGSPRVGVRRPLRNCVADMVQLMGTAEMPAGKNGWAEFVAAVPHVAARIAAENVAPSKVTRIALLLLAAGVFAEIETPATTVVRPRPVAATAARARPRG